jgi:hypothetical protein
MNLEAKVRDAFQIIGILFEVNPDEMSVGEVREAYKKALLFITGVVVGNVLTYDKLKQLGEQIKKVE